MGFFSDVFGGILGGSEGRTEQAQRIYGPQEEFLRERYYPALTELFETGAGAIPGFDPLQRAGQEAALREAERFTGGILPGAEQALGTLFGAADVGAPLTQRAIEAATSPIFERFESTIAPQIRRSMAASQPGGGTRAGLMTRRAGQQALRAAGDVAAPIALGAHQAGLGAMGRALSLAPSIARMGFVPSELQRGIGAERRAMDVARSPFGFLSQIQSLFGQPVVLGRSTTTQETRPGIGDIFRIGLSL